MKIFITSILIALLTACGSCENDVIITTVETQQQVSEPFAPVTDPVVAPVPVKCSETITEGCFAEFCPSSTTNTVNCPVSPYPYIPRGGVTTEPSPTPVCVRDSTPLVFVDPFWVDNCGNKYGQVTI